MNTAEQIQTIAKMRLLNVLSALGMAQYFDIIPLPDDSNGEAVGVTTNYDGIEVNLRVALYKYEDKWYVELINEEACTNKVMSYSRLTLHAACYAMYQLCAAATDLNDVLRELNDNVVYPKERVPA